MAAPFYIVNTKSDYDAVIKYDAKCGLITRSRDRSEIIKVAHIIDDKTYEYFITTKNRLILSGANYRGKEKEEKRRKHEEEQAMKPKRRYEMVFYKEVE